MTTEACEITWDGYLHISAQLAARYFPADVCVAARRDQELVLMPLHGQANGGLIFKRRNRAGDRSLLINELLGYAPHPGRFGASWDPDRGALLVALSQNASG